MWGCWVPTVWPVWSVVSNVFSLTKHTGQRLPGIWDMALSLLGKGLQTQTGCGSQHLFLKMIRANWKPSCGPVSEFSLAGLLAGENNNPCKTRRFQTPRTDSFLLQTQYNSKLSLSAFPHLLCLKDISGSLRPVWGR